VRLGLLAWRAVLVGCFAKSVLLEKAKALSAALHIASLSFAWHPLAMPTRYANRRHLKSWRHLSELGLAFRDRAFGLVASQGAFSWRRLKPSPPRCTALRSVSLGILWEGPNRCANRRCPRSCSPLESEFIRLNSCDGLRLQWAVALKERELIGAQAIAFDDSRMCVPI
jgi:hypothetical protein